MKRDRFAEMVWEFEVGCRLPDREPRLELAGRDHPLGAGYRQGPGEAIRVRELVVGHDPDRTSLIALRPACALTGQFSGVPENDIGDRRTRLISAREAAEFCESPTLGDS